MKLYRQPFNVTIIQFYAATTDAEEREVDKFYGHVQTEIGRTCKQNMCLWLETGMPVLEILRKKM